LSNFLAQESCGQCVPCKSGGRIITEHLYKIENHEATQDNIDAIVNEFGKITNQTRCFLPTEEQILISSLLEKFPEEFRAHLAGPCPYHRNPELPLIDSFDEEAHQFKYTAKEEHLVWK
ncbi:MAG: hypothetical protein NUV91_08255, partial [Candidatus Omnitrophica bacterium]|nr:hypothetical protein [Candidatus Omnitrophota bacterium]